MNDLLNTLQDKFPHLEFQPEAPLAPYTAVKIGGPAEVLVTIDSAVFMIEVAKFCQQKQISVTILGWGANTLIADRGIRGLVIRNASKELEIRDDVDSEQIKLINDVAHRHTVTSPDQSFAELDYQELENTPRVQVTISSGWPLASLIAALLSQGVTGLQWYSRIPATIGGAIVNNIHGGTHFLSELVEFVEVLTPEGDIKRLTPQECDFGYDFSRFHHSNEIILSVSLILWKGDVEKARSTVAAWAKLKSNQPQRSLGCVFQNITAEQQQQLNLPTPSIGYIIDHVLGLKGKRRGGAQISTQHAAFIENVDSATAQDYLDLAIEIIRATKEKLDISLKPEIFFRGFEPDEVQELIKPNSL